MGIGRYCLGFVLVLSACAPETRRVVDRYPPLPTGPHQSAKSSSVLLLQAMTTIHDLYIRPVTWDRMIETGISGVEQSALPEIVEQGSLLRNEIKMLTNDKQGAGAFSNLVETAGKRITRRNGVRDIVDAALQGMTDSLDEHSLYYTKLALSRVYHKSRVQQIPTEGSLLGNVAYMHVGQFDLQVVSDFRREMARLRLMVPGNFFEGMILDLRGSPGGLLDEVYEVANILLPPQMPV